MRARSNPQSNPQQPSHIATPRKLQPSATLSDPRQPSATLSSTPPPTRCFYSLDPPSRSWLSARLLSMAVACCSLFLLTCALRLMSSPPQGGCPAVGKHDPGCTWWPSISAPAWFKAGVYIARRVAKLFPSTDAYWVVVFLPVRHVRASI